LLSLSQQAGIAFYRINDRILVSPMEKGSSALVENIIERNVRITGKITDAVTGDPLVGASVIITGTRIGTIADTEGNYVLEVPEETLQLTCSYIGYQPKTIELGNQMVLDIMLEVDTQSLEEVIVVGYGVQDKRDVTGAISSVKGEDIGQN